MTRGREDTWRARPVLASVLRLAALLVPLVVAVLTSLALIAVLPSAGSTVGEVAWWTAVLGGSIAAALLTDRLARRVLPLSVLLELSLVFPDRAPSRLKTVRGASVRALDQQLQALRQAGERGDAVEVAETLVILVGVLGLHDKKTRGHSERVRAYVDLLAEELDLPEQDRLRLRWSALIHDLGKLTVPTSVLNGPSDLDDEAWDQLHRHPEEGARLAAGLLPWLGEWGDAVVQHHERWDGTGYPAGLAGEGITRGARIVAVADAFEVMTSNRSYRKATTAAAARRELADCSGTQFDPTVVRAFLGISLGRLAWVLGPLSWLSVLPVASAADKAGQAAKAGTAAAAVAALVAGGVVTGPAGTSGDQAAVAGTSTTAGPGPQAPPAPGPSPAPPPVVPTPPAPPSSDPAPSDPAPSDPLPPAPSPTVPTSSPDPAPSTSPTAAPTSDPTPSPSPSASPTTGPSPSPTTPPSPSPSPTPSPSTSPPPPPPSPTPSATSPVPTTATYYLTGSTLSASAPTGATPTTATLPAGGASASFDLAVPTGTALTGTPQVAVFVDTQRDKGAGNVSGQLALVLRDCTTATGPCTDLASGSLTTGGKGTGTQEETTALSAVNAAVLPGHVLRLVVSLGTQGNADRAVLSFGAASTPSRLALTAAPPP